MMMRTTHPALLFPALLLFLTACATEVLGGGTGGGEGVSNGTGAGTTTSTGAGNSNGAGAGNGDASNALAMRAADLPGGRLPWANSGGMPDDVSGLLPPDVDPDALVLILGNTAQTCAAPQGPTCGVSDGWQDVIIIPPELDRPGSIDITDDQRIIEIMGGYQGSPSGTNCGYGGGQGPGIVAMPGPGTLEISSSDPSSLTITLTGGVKNVNSSIIDGTYKFLRCDAAPPVAPPTPAVAILGSRLPAGSSSSMTVGSSPDPTALYVFAGTSTETCSAPLSSLVCTGAGRLSFRLPTSLQVPGTVELTDPLLTASFDVSKSSPPTCTPSTDETQLAVTVGQLEILSIDTSSISFRLFQAHDGLSYDFDGLYTATICP